jgi:hypothetical protein
MVFQRGDVVEIPFLLGKGAQNHPAIILSNEEVYAVDEAYLCVMVTHSKHRDIFAFELTGDMFNQPLGQGEYMEARLHLVTYILKSHITPNTHTGRRRMKQNAVDRLVEHIKVKALSQL